VTFECLEFSRQDGVARITLARPEVGNAMNFDLVRELAQAALVCDNDPAIKVVLLTGSGRSFCVGGDLKAFAGLGDETALKLKALADELHKAVSLFARMTAPLVIAVNGVAAGAGFSLTLTGDYVIASDAAKFTMAYTAAGLSPDGSSTYYLPRLVGMRRAQELALTNRVLSASEAHAWGLVTRVVEPGDLEAEALTICRQLAAGPGLAQAGVKQLLLGSLGTGLETQMELEGRLIARTAASQDGLEGIAAFLEKRPARFA
jgi:2-(1,2-epoxy-1,2-dihydrophenyl)acetyl-CoA isomerase